MLQARLWVRAGEGSCRSLSCDYISSPERPPPRLHTPAQGEEGLCPAVSRQGKLGRGGSLFPCQAWHMGPEAPKEGSLHASGVLCRESLAGRDKLRHPSTSPSSPELLEHILMGPIQLSLCGN